MEIKIKTLLIASVAGLGLTAQVAALPFNPPSNGSTFEPGTTLNTTHLNATSPPHTSFGRGDSKKKIMIECGAVAGCHNKERTFNPSEPMPEHTCPRDALAARMKWNLFCHSPTNHCWSQEPSIDACCRRTSDADSNSKGKGKGNGKGDKRPSGLRPPSWPALDDPKEDDSTKDLRNSTESHSSKGKGKGKAGKRPSGLRPPSWPALDGETDKDEEETTDDSSEYDMPILPDSKDYREDVETCKMWRTRNDDEYMYFMQNLWLFGEKDVDEKGKDIIPGSDDGKDAKN